VQAAARGAHDLGFVLERDVFGQLVRYLDEVDVDPVHLVRAFSEVGQRPSLPPALNRARIGRSVLNAMFEERVLAGRRTTGTFRARTDAGLVGPPDW
jgi:hypothetical protein